MPESLSPIGSHGHLQEVMKLAMLLRGGRARNTAPSKHCAAVQFDDLPLPPSSL